MELISGEWMAEGNHTINRWMLGPKRIRVSKESVRLATIWLAFGIASACSSQQSPAPQEDVHEAVDTREPGDTEGDGKVLGDSIDAVLDMVADAGRDALADGAADQASGQTDSGLDQEPDDQIRDEFTPDDAVDVSDKELPDAQMDLQGGQENLCTPNCEGRECGDDGCGNQCGSCPEGFFCMLEAGGTKCHPDCSVLCAGLECGTAPEAAECACGTCNSPNPCEDAICSQGKCGFSDNAAECDDGNPCTSPDSCSEGSCVGTWLPSEQLAQLSCLCGSDTECEALDDGDACNGVLKCLPIGDVSVCVKAPGTETSCEDGLSCTLDTCAGSQCEHELMPFFCQLPGLGCVPYGTANQLNECLRCLPDFNTTEWTGAPDGTACGMGSVCFEHLCCDRAAHCAGQQCGSDGCGGVCGTCAVGLSCHNGQCESAACVDQCAGRACGPDGCGGTCGTCPAGHVCLADGTCLCIPECFGKQCGEDSCGSVCGMCPVGATCQGGKCISEPCAPECGSRQCGSDGCGGVCGVCSAGSWCNMGVCQETVGTGSCQGHCGGSAGDCYCDDLCGLFGVCCSDLCTACPTAVACKCGDGICDPPESCRLCPADCFCPAGQVCVGDECCTPSCEGKPCGPDGCGGTCGACELGQACNAEGSCTCVPNCAGRNCGSDGCGGTCGSCTDTDALTCTAADCIDGVCGRSVSTFFCVIQETCLPSGTENPDTVCQKCLPTVNPWDWSPVATGTSCGTGQTCHGGQCCPYNCDGRNCGPDGCGGTCGECALGDDACYEGVCGVCGDGNTIDWDGCNAGVISEFQVNSTGSGQQTGADVAVGEDGRAMIVWYNDSTEGPGQGIVGSLYDPITGELGPETMLVSGKSSCGVLARPGGGYVMAAGASTGQIGGVLQLLDDNGQLLGEPVTASTSAMVDVELYGGSPDVFAFVSDSQVGLWGRLDILQFDFSLSNSVIMHPFLSGAGSSDRCPPAISFFDDNAFVSAYYFRETIPTILTADGFSPSGTGLPRPTGGPVFESTKYAPLSSIGPPGVVTFPDGHVLLTYSTDAGQKMALLVANATPVSVTSVISDSVPPVMGSTKYQRGIIARTTDKDAVVVWTGNGAEDTQGIYFRIATMTGFTSYSLAGDILRANSYVSGVQTLPAVASWPDGSFIIVWDSDGQDGSSFGVYARRFDANGLELPREAYP